MRRARIRSVCAHAGLARRRRGAAYIFFLGTALLVTVIGMSSMMALRVAARSAEDANQGAESLLLAQSAIEFGLLAVYSDSAWRNNIAHNSWKAAQPLGDGVFSWKLVDEINASLTVDRNAPVRIYGRGSRGGSVWVYSALLQPPAEVEPTNRLMNPGLESGAVTPWTASGTCQLQVDGSGPSNGTASLRVTNRMPGSGVQQALAPLVSCSTYRASVRVKSASSAETFWFGVSILTASGTQYYELARASVGTSWTQISGTITPEFGGACLSASWVIASDNVAEFWLDDAIMTAAPTVIGIIPATWRRETQ